ncbi:ESX-1 secretion-associated protein [Mycobacterium shimoidei]|uniref:ESX-1 secretion-associated protein n=1 Tax=Mycobacterium shimoidei TaxID=29313 RepID=UPI000848AC1A|nr:ESX-1 secretion-associated protein [Mycobacterium shimoidei]MCV7259625.1 ESX-1 secretion-associated protein [Mycobacterium shimoidei]ODR12199.1 hypothetical protein BHQ16_16755 [Mycobacterium shimoidei]ORW78021.1 hypothetical protein AWC26_18525 [Mycobacterium shimoidei]
MTDLHFTAEYIRSLATLQKDAARGIGYATLAVDKVGQKVSTTHGSICAVTASAVKDAEKERSLATDKTQTASSDLAVKLKQAADKYDEIDAAEKRRIDAQMRPGG